MRKFGLLLVSAAGLAICGAGAMADTAPAATDSSQVAASSSDLDKIVCRSMAPETGTRLGNRRVCHTQREWNDIHEQNEKETSHMQIHNNLPPRGN